MCVFFNHFMILRTLGKVQTKVLCWFNLFLITVLLPEKKSQFIGMLVYISKCVKERVENVFHCLLPYFINKLY